MEIDIIFEDEHLLVVNKPCGLATQADEKNTESLVELVSGTQPLFVVHRLDQRVSGLVVFAKSKTIAAQLSTAFQGRDVRKFYRAMIASRPPHTQEELTHWLVKDSKLKKAKIVKETTPKAQKALLAYRLNKQSERYSLLEIELFTGRFHQIRVQLAAIGCPIVGDLKYGYKRSTPDGSIYLQAFQLTLKHPVSHKNLTFELPLPQTWERYGF